MRNYASYTNHFILKKYIETKENKCWKRNVKIKVTSINIIYIDINVTILLYMSVISKVCKYISYSNKIKFF